MQILLIQTQEKDGKQNETFITYRKGKEVPEFTQKEIDLYKVLLVKYVCPLKKPKKFLKRFENITERAIRYNGRCSVKRLIEWVCCPICGSKTRIKIRSDTELKNFPLTYITG